MLVGPVDTPPRPKARVVDLRASPDEPYAVAASRLAALVRDALDLGDPEIVVADGPLAPVDADGWKVHAPTCTTEVVAVGVPDPGRPPQPWERAVLDVLASALAIAHEAQLQRGELGEARLRLGTAEERLRTITSLDPLTGLLHRAAFAGTLAGRLVDGPTPSHRVAVIVVDLDGFKALSDSLGYAASDRLLVTIGRRIQGVLGESDVLARLGADDFGVLTVVDDVSDAERLAGALLVAVRQPLTLRGRALTVTASIGIALADRTSDADSLLRDADTAMRRAERFGRGRAEVCDEDLRVAAAWRTETEQALRQAVERDQLVLHYQPVVDLGSGRIDAAEALVRWQHPTKGLLAAGDFVNAAESAGLMPAIGQWVIDEAIAQLGRWHREHPDHPIAVGINLSEPELADPKLRDHVDGALRREGIRHEWFVIEVTETLFSDDEEAVVRGLLGLRELGVHLMIDDFGTGFSSLSRLQRLPVHGLKVDRSFVAGLERDGTGRAIVTTTLQLAETLGLQVTAEGIETPAQLAWLRNRRCDHGQGLLWSGAVAPERISQMLTESAGSFAT